MDDLLIVRYSERTRTRRVRRNSSVPLNANLSMILGAALGLVLGVQLMSENPDAPAIAILFGLIIGLAAGFLLTRLTKRYRHPRKQRRYNGMPIETDEDSNDGHTHSKKVRLEDF